jgi:predicted nucleic acid-binding protein
VRRHHINTIIDSGVFIASAFSEALSIQSAGLLDRFEEAHVVFNAPTLFRYELISVCRKIVYRQRASVAIARSQLNDLLGIHVKLHFDDELLIRAYEIAEGYNLPTAYDAQYLALAERLSCEFWTLDEHLFNAINNRFPDIRWVGNWRSEA